MFYLFGIFLLSAQMARSQGVQERPLFALGRPAAAAVPGRKEGSSRKGRPSYSFRRMPEESEISLASFSSDRARFRLRMEVPAISASTSFV